MLLILFIMNSLFSLIFMGLNHPLSFGCILLIQTIIISLMLGYIFYNFWFSYILFLIMIGGMLVMFLYMTSVASNEKFKIPKIILAMSLMMLLSMILISMNMDNFYSNLFTMKMKNFSYSSTNFFNFCLSKFFNYPNMKLLITMTIYLLITLITVVKIVEIPYSTLHQKNKWLKLLKKTPL